LGAAAAPHSQPRQLRIATRLVFQDRPFRQRACADINTAVENASQRPAVPVVRAPLDTYRPEVEKHAHALLCFQA